MMMKKHSYIKCTFQKALTFPVFLFVFLVTISFIAFFGRRYIVSQEFPETIKCSATGAMGGGFPSGTETDDVFTKMEDLGLKWYQGLIADDGGIEPAVESINSANSYDVDVIVRICYQGHCNYKNPDASNYIFALNQISNGVSGKQFYAIAGHNEPNSAEWEEPEFEKNFMLSVLNANLPSNIKLLSPIIDISPGEVKGRDYKQYLSELEISNLQRLEGLAVNVYEHDEYTVYERVNELRNWMINNNLGGLDIFVTETGPWEDQNYESFLSSYRQMTQIANVEAALFYKPTGLYDPDRHITLEQVCEVVKPCHGQDCDTYEIDPNDYPEIFGYDSSVINQCAFEDTPLPSCETRGSLKMKEKLELIYDPVSSSILPPPPSSVSTCVVQNDSNNANNGIVVEAWSNINGSQMIVYAKATKPELNGAGLGHYQFGLEYKNGQKIQETYWSRIWEGQTISYTFDIGSFNSNEIQGYVLLDSLAGCQKVIAANGGEIPPENIGEDIDPTWIAKYVFTARISRLPAMEYFASCEYEGTYATEYNNSLCVSKKRVSPGKIYDSEQGITYEYDVMTEYPGYGKLISDSGSELKVEYNAGSGVLLGSMGPYDDYTQVSNGIPAHFIKDNEVTQEDLELDTTYSANYPGKKALEDLKEWMINKLKKTPCKNDGKDYTTFTGVYANEPTSGYETVSDYGEYVYKLPDIINKSNLVGANCERFEEDQNKCKIATDLSACSIYIDPTTGTVIPGSEADLLECLKSFRIEVWHSTGDFNDFELSGAAGILETYWKSLNNYTFGGKRICQKENIGIEVMIKGRLYDLSEDSCDFEDVAGDDEECSPPPKADCSGGKGKSMKAYIPYLGSAVTSISAFSDLEQFSYYLADTLNDCPDTNDLGMCYCQTGEIDPLAIYLYDIGALETQLEYAMTGATEEELEGSI
ncbi:MAG: hypothetical protein ABIE03_01080 [Patescibacteria group bacterium]|nr:hypothetical protein [Patescibacteria group bacterium]